MAQHYTSGRFKSFLDPNTPNVGGRLYTYVSGTTTHKDAYTDATLGTPCTYAMDGLGKLYIALDSRGEAQVWLGSGAYTFVEQTSTGVLVDTTDGVSDVSGALVTELSATSGSSLVGFLQVGTGAVPRTMQDKGYEIVTAGDYGATGSSTVTDSAAIQAACAANPGKTVIVNSFIATSIDLSTLSLPTNVVLIDERYSSSGWALHHSQGNDSQLMLRGLSDPATFGEGPALVLQNMNTSGNRTASIVHWWGTPGSTQVGSYFHMGYQVDAATQFGYEYIAKGSVDSGFRARYRIGPDGSSIMNPNGDASSYLNNPEVAFSQNILQVWNMSLQTGYAKSGKPLGYMGATVTSLATELRLTDDVGTVGAGVTNAKLAFQTGHGPSAVTSFSIINNYPSSGLLTIRDEVNGKDLISFRTNGGALVFESQLAGASTGNNTLFRDTDDILKYKDAAGVIHALY